MFSKIKKRKLFGDLYANKKILIGASDVLTTPESIAFVAGDRRLEFKFSEISSVECSGKTLSFVHKHRKYLFVGESDLNTLYEAVRELTGKCDIRCNKNARYAVYRADSGKFEETEGDVRILIVKDGLFFLRIETTDEVIHLEEISTSIQYYMDQKNMTFVWSVLRDGSFRTFSVRFPDNLSFLEFLSKYVSCLYKNVNRERGEDKEAERHFEKMEVENYQEEQEQEASSESGEGYESCDDDELENHFGEIEDKNEHLVVGDEMAFITRGRSVGVFENTGNGLEFRANIKDVLEDNVEKIITHDKCSSLVYLKKDERDKLRMLDLERGEEVETWDVGRNINDYFDSQKLVDTGTLVGLSDYSVFRIDPRSKNKIVESKEYKTKNEFSCGVATGKGHVAVANKKGDIRLYDRIDKRAKSLLPGFGDEIKHLDVTSDGRYIIYTCKSYLMLLTVPEDYKQSVGKDKPIPKRLQLRPEHLMYINEEVNFTPAKFSTDEAEDSIITSTGSYVVKWNLNDVLEGKLYSYQLTKCNDLVVADNFEFGENDNVIVAMPDDIRKVSVRNLKKPGRNTRM